MLPLAPGNPAMIKTGLLLFLAWAAFAGSLASDWFPLSLLLSLIGLIFACAASDRMARRGGR